MASLVQAEEDVSEKWIALIETIPINNRRHIVSTDGVRLCKKRGRNIRPMPSYGMVTWESVRNAHDVCRQCKRLYLKMSEMGCWEKVFRPSATAENDFKTTSCRFDLALVDFLSPPCFVSGCKVS